MQSVLPRKLKLDRTTGLSIEWSDGSSQSIPLKTLRAKCPCATCREQRASQTRSRLTVLPADNFTDEAAIATNAEMVGNYALRITWKDGHSSGIYSFEHLRTL